VEFLPKKRKEGEEEVFRAEDFVKPEDKFKLSLLNMERRFVDVEFAVSELAARIKGLDAEELKTFKTHLEDIEDLILVEQAGIIELKSVMERVDQGFESSAKAADVSAIKDRVKRIENLARAAAEMANLPSELTEETKMKIRVLEEEIAELKSMPVAESVNPLEIGNVKKDMRMLGDKLSVLRMAVEDSKRTIDRKVQEAIAGAQVTTADFEFVNSKIRSLKSGIDMLSDRRVEMDLKLTDLAQKISSLEREDKESLPNKLLEGLKTSRKDLEIVKLRTDSIERVIRELSNNMREVEASAKKFEGFERLRALQNDVDDKLKQFRFIQSEIKRLSNRVEMIYDSLDKRLARIRTTEREVNAMTQALSETKKQIEHMRFDMKNYARREDVGKIMKVSKNESRLFDKTANDIKMLKEKMDVIEDFVVRKIGVMSTSGKPSTKTMDTFKEMNERIAKIENSLNEVRTFFSRMPPPQTGLTEYETRMGDIVDKLIFLESRMAALESVFQATPKAPIIIE
jgi:chromosome segregation ATPase